MKVGMENEELLKQFTLTVVLPASEGKRPLAGRRWAGEAGGGGGSGEKFSAWNHLSLSHSVSWPLHILFTPAILEK